MSAALLVALGFAVMEPVAYLAHRFVMHGRLGRWHRSHHHARVGRFEANDLYPVVLGSLTFLVMLAGATIDGLRPLLWLGAGVTLYGGAYLFVHDLYIHRRLARFTWSTPRLDRVREAHRVHHLWAGEPYGFLFPIVPTALRERAAGVSRDPLRPSPPAPPSATSAPSPAG